MDQDDAGEWEKLAVIENPFEAQILESILTEEGIDYRIRSYHDTAYDGLFQMHKGWGEVRGPGPEADRIREILDDIRTAGHNREDAADTAADIAADTADYTAEKDADAL